ncbi:peptidase C45 acyl-coenzyme A:6-aminopenicillanic acid acyl-transferase [Rhodopirellula maiorica SM1]|uniref:Peptidase C45 acyl-coenzyme A:6-aminopenicillanic acid acyl-transferase n=1 Tax=Rhodopirellula maiorica SM1 TaxID=1265738 RepID=M5RUH3_9BACT|nr:C45 family peptidase [Rhodopirellula maiorica]EMI22993.1 peptidase C45 acyl-coenzyme A:6-aminopenicillanic acid acyl-transferase [Rhodopirellula maiorica SM1]
MPSIEMLTIDGDAAAMGLAHGAAFRSEIQTLTEERMRLCHDRFWIGEGNMAVDPAALADACWEQQRRYDDLTTAELEAIARAADVPARDLLVTGGFTDFVDALRGTASGGTISRAPVDDPGQCTAVLVAADAAADRRPLLAQTWDMHPTATPYIRVLDLRSTDQPAAVVFTVTGCPAMIGVNEHGLAIGINNMVTADGRAGVMWTSVVRRMLRARNADEALQLLKEAPVAGAHHYLLLDAKSIGYSVERSPTRVAVRGLESTLSHTNHCLNADLISIEPPRGDAPAYSTRNRLREAEEWLVSNPSDCSRRGLWQLLNRFDPSDPLGSICHGPQPGYDVETGGAVVISPRDVAMDAVWGQGDVRHDADRMTPQTFHVFSRSQTPTTH